MLWCFLLLFVPGVAAGRKNCGGNFTARRGILQTPNFPKKFNTPIDCEWIIKSEKENTSIIVYLAQMYVFEGLTFTEYVEYDKRLPGVVILSGEDVVKGKYLQCHKNVLVISLKLSSIENNHIRVMDNFMDVYGFNITYEITSGEVRKDHCNMMDCGFTGICYDYVTKFGCQCFPGYSGSSCSEGPKSGCTNADGSPLCQNGAICRHIGDSFIKCECPDGFTGEYCSSSTKSEEHEIRPVSCIIKDRQNPPCRCKDGENISTNDLYAYTGIVQLKNFPASEDTYEREYILSQISANFQSNLTDIRYPHIINLERSSQTELGVTFRLYGSKSSENHLRSVINKWGNIGLIGNMTVVNPDIAVYKEPIILSIQSVGVNPGAVIHENDEFILSCSAQGSPNMSFRWYKDGMFVNLTRFKNNKWMTLRRGSSLTNYLAVLNVDKATVLDGGLFTCQVEDFNIQQCLSKRVEIRSRPVVTLDTMSLTVAKSESFSIKCSSYNSGGTSIYGWTKNGHLLPTKTKRERYDTLYLTGSLLRVSGLSKSANYSCLVQDRTTKSEMSVSVIVVDKKRIKTCLKDYHSNVTWPETAPGYESIQSCPRGYTGLSRRMCVMLDANYPQWEKPDMSECVSTSMGFVLQDFQYLRLSYEASSPLQILNRTRDYLNTNVTLLEGEGVIMAKLISDIVFYIDKSNTSINSRSICSTAFMVVDKILLQNQSFPKETQITDLQRTVKQLLFLCKRFSSSIDTFIHTGPSITASIQPINKLTNFRSDLTTKRTKILFELTFVEEDKQYVNSLLSIVYNNLKNFLPPRSVLRINDSELDYIIVSDIVATWYINFEKEIEFSNIFIFSGLFGVDRSSLMYGGNFSCVQADFAPYGYYWNKTVCDTHILNETAVNCLCKKFGTIAIIATRDASLEYMDSIKTPHRVIVLMGCSVCLLLVIFSAVALTFHWIYHRNSITYLKSQCCYSLIGAMSIFVVVQTNNIKNDSYLYINTLLQIFFLTSISTQLNILLIIYSDFLLYKSKRNVKPTSICVITGAPIIITIGNYISHVSMNLKLYSWWIVIGSTSFYIFLICCSILTILYITLYCIIIRYIKTKDCINISKDRVLLLKKSLYIFHVLILVITSSILYINIIENIMCHFVFSFASLCLGIVLLFCYALKFDHLVEEYFLRKISLKTIDESKKGSITLDNNPNIPERSHQDNQILSSPEIHSKGEAILSKHSIISVDKQKRLLKNVNAPDILSRESCANLDLVSSNIQQYQNEESTSCVSSPDEKNPLATENQSKTSDSLKNTEQFRSAKSVNFDESVTAVGTETEINNSKSEEVQDCREIRKCSKCVQDANCCECEVNKIDGNSTSKLQVPPNITETAKTGRIENLDAVMCSISHDLDYLLNRSDNSKTN